MDEASAAAAVPVQKAKQQQQHRLKKAPASIASHHAKTSLVALCRAVVTTNLERYPPESFGICDPDEWQAIVRLRHASTQPKRVIGAAVTGLDGTGRLVPAVAEKLLHAIEECNPHLSDCPVADTLMWKDCVEYRFRRGAGLTRPTALHLPWPLLVHELQVQANHLMTSSASPTVDIQEVINILRAAPMNVALLKDSGVGKTVKKAIKKVDAEWKTQLEDLLSVWMEMAATDGVVSSNTQTKHDDTTQEDLELAETCHSWRQLFAVLQHRNEELRTTQGKRMREIRNNLAKTRPKLVKVRPSVATAKQQRVLDRSPGREGGNAKVAQLRKEAAVQVARQKTSVVRPKISFGDAVAFACVSKKGMAHKRKKIGGTIQQLGDGKRMKVPTKIVQGGGSRQFASKWKVTKK